MNIDNEYKYNFKLNNKSLLFARVASDAIKDGEYEKALSLLENGIEQFDEYPTPFFLMGDLLIKLGKVKEAEIAFQKGNSLLNNSSTLNYYLNLTQDIIENVATNAEAEPSENNDDELVELEDKIKTAKIEISHENFSKTDDTIQKETEEEFKPLKGLVSETLASIYMNQSNYKEAKAIYRTLIDIQPEREEYFITKISEINLKMTPRKSEDD